MHVSRAMAAAALPDRAVLKLVDHLNSTLTACAELERCLPLDGGEESIGLALRTELAAITHLLQSRSCAGEVMRTDTRLAECAELFLVGTQVLEFASAMPANEYMLGRRLPISSAVQFTTLMLEAIAGVFAPPAQADSSVAVPVPEAKAA